MISQATDFRDESEALYQLLEPLTDADYQQPTQFKSWTPDDVLGHLHLWNVAADLSLTDEPAFLELLTDVMQAVAAGDFRGFERRWRGDLSGLALRETWRDFYLPMSQRFEQADPKTRVKWAGPEMSVRSSITARLMETWAHGQELYDIMGVERIDTDRIQNIAVLGINTFGWTFKNRCFPVPEVVPHVRLTAPSGDTWEWNAETESDRVEGSATEFCQVVTQVRNVADTQLQVTGEVATRWMEIAQCFAGPPENPPAPGTRFKMQA